MLLQVSAPFHCALMQPAADVMAQALAQVTVKPPVVPVVANVMAKPISDPAEIVRALGRSKSLARCAGANASPSWRQPASMTFYEVGAGKVLSGLIKRIAEGVSVTAIGTPGRYRRVQSGARRADH